MEFRNLFFQRATRQCDTERTLLEGNLVRIVSGRFLAQSFGARVLSLSVAPDAVIGVIQCANQVSALIGQLEAFSPANVLRTDGECRDAQILDFLGMVNQILRIGLRWSLEQYASMCMCLPGRRLQGPCSISQGQIQMCRVGGFIRLPLCDMVGEGQFVETAPEQRGQFPFNGGAVNLQRFRPLVLCDGAALDELAFDRIQRRQIIVLASQSQRGVCDVEQLSNEPLQVRRQGEQQGRLCLGVQTGRP